MEGFSGSEVQLGAKGKQKWLWEESHSAGICSAPEVRAGSSQLIAHSHRLRTTAEALGLALSRVAQVHSNTI